MRQEIGGDRGFSITELLLVVAMIGTIAAVSVPIITNVTDGMKLGNATRELERELQSARLKAVSTNRPLRVRLNCPTAGFYRTVEVIGTAADSDSNRCALSAYPFPVPDTNIVTRPNYDGPLRALPDQTTVTSLVFEFRPDGSTRRVVGGVAQAIGGTPVTVTVARRGRTRNVTVNGVGRIQIQQ